MVWWNMPLRELAVFLAEIEPLQAKESLRRINEIRLAHASIDDRQAQMAIIGWENEAKRVGRIEEEKPKMTKEEYFSSLARVAVKIV